MTVEPAYFVCGFDGCLLEELWAKFLRDTNQIEQEEIRLTVWKLLLLAVLFIIIAFYCYGQNILEFAMRPGENKKIKYDLDVSKIQSLKKGAITKKVIEGIIKNYPQEKIKIKNREDGVIKYEIYEEGVSIQFIS